MARASKTMQGVQAVVLLAILGVVGFFVWHRVRQAWWDGSDWLAEARSEAADWAGDAVLVTFEGTMIDGAGQAQIGGGWKFELRSAAAAAGPRTAPAPMPGAPASGPRPGCIYEFRMEPYEGRGGNIAIGGALESCRDAVALPTPPRCTISAVLAHGKAKGAPAPALYDVSLTPAPGGAVWTFRVMDRANDASRALFETTFPDDC